MFSELDFELGTRTLRSGPDNLNKPFGEKPATY